MYTRISNVALSLTCMLAFATAGSADVTTVEETTTTTTTPQSRTTVIMPIGPTASHTSSSVTEEYPVVGNPTYMKRVTMLREQLGNAVTKGWIGGDEASGFRTRLDELAATATSIDAAHESSPAADSLESQINALNIDLSSRLATH